VRIRSDVPLIKNAILFLHVGDAQLNGEILRVQGNQADAQIFDEKETCAWAMDYQKWRPWVTGAVKPGGSSRGGYKQ
jgi:hypothetical protein